MRLFNLFYLLIGWSYFVSYGWADDFMPIRSRDTVAAVYNGFDNSNLKMNLMVNDISYQFSFACIKIVKPLEFTSYIENKIPQGAMISINVKDTLSNELTGVMYAAGENIARVLVDMSIAVINNDEGNKDLDSHLYCGTHKLNYKSNMLQDEIREKEKRKEGENN